MFKKEIKFEVPIFSKCEKCNKKSRVIDVDMIHTSVLRVFYKCEECQHKTCKLKRVEFI
ncbi:hypothetical protein [Clostridium thermobutyricum]|uniref:hypothetical protein n=1 Tax=Clostridium thermobutyricum TaxID=29372 RepID=UPI002943C6C2|nr:hypothetical protein [Clostridium thermobutyricum]